MLLYCRRGPNYLCLSIPLFLSVCLPLSPLFLPYFHFLPTTPFLFLPPCTSLGMCHPIMKIGICAVQTPGYLRHAPAALMWPVHVCSVFPQLFSVGRYGISLYHHLQTLSTLLMGCYVPFSYTDCSFSYKHKGSFMQLPFAMLIAMEAYASLHCVMHESTRFFGGWEP